MILEIVLLLLACALFYLMIMKRPEGLPPGDWGYPIIGRLVSRREGVAKIIEEQRNKYGNIFSVKIGSRIFIFLADYKLIKTAFSKPELSGRPNFYSFDAATYFTGFGLAFESGHLQITNRKFALKTLSDFGMGKSKLEPIIDHEITELLKNLSLWTNNLKTVDWNIINVSVLNIIWQIVAAKRYNQNDEEVKCLCNVGMKVDEIMNNCLPIDIFPWLTKLPNIIKNAIFQTDELNRQLEILRKFIDIVIDEHVRTFNKDVIRDLIDAYLFNLENTGGGKNENKFQNELLNLNVLLKDLFIAGTDTTANALKWFFLYMCKFPEVQEKIQREIDYNVGTQRRPDLSDRRSLPYLDATLNEVNRIVTLVPNAVVHSATEDTDFKGYKIPKGSVIWSCTEVCHMSPEYFDDPHVFRPERFLTSDGKVDFKKEGYFPFSVGRRSCIGESLATMELFLFVSAIFQKFLIRGAEGEDPDLQADVSNVFFNLPKPYSVYACNRKNYYCCE